MEERLQFYQADTINNMEPIGLPDELRSSIKQIFQDEDRKSKDTSFRTRLYTSPKYFDLRFNHSEEQTEPLSGVTSSPVSSSK